MELAMKKAILLAKAKLVDRVYGEMNNQTTINKSETGSNSDLKVTSESSDVINNKIQDTVAEGYVVTKSELYVTRNKSFRAYVLIEIKKSAFDI